MSIESPQWDASERAQQIVKESIVIDSLANAMFPLTWTEESQFHEYFDRALAAGITTVCLTTGTDPWHSTDFIRMTAKCISKMNERPERYVLVRTAADIRAAHVEGRQAIYFTSQGCSTLDNNLEMIGYYRQLGVGYMLLAYNSRYRTGDGCMEIGNAGLTLYGKQVVDAMNRYGMVVDLTHVGERTALDATERSSAPVIYSHSNPKTVFDYQRNITEEQVKACAKTGGVVSPTFVGFMISDDFPNVVTPEHCVRSIDEIVQMVGIDHVGFSSDDMFIIKPVENYAKISPEAYDDGGVTLKGAESGAFCTGEPAKILPAVVDGLLAKGYSGEDVKKVLGGNSLRVYEQVWR